MKKINKPIINPDFEQILSSVMTKLPQSLLISGEPGVGLTTIAKHIAGIYGIVPTIIYPEKDEIIDIEKGFIGIDIIRRLYNETKTINVDKRIIIIDYAERMTIQSQNAFLKLLEEPNNNLYFILLSHSTAKLLPTIISRVENLNVKPITSEQSEYLLESMNIIDKTKRTQLLFMATGLPAELTRLTNDNNYFDKRVAMMQDARTILQANLYQKLLLAHQYKDNRALALLLLLDAMKILNNSIIKNPQFDTINYIDRVLNTYQRIEANGNIRLCLAQMVI